MLCSASNAAEGSLAALDAHFSAQYEQFMRSLDQFIDELQKSSEAASDLGTTEMELSFHDDLAAGFEADGRPG